MKRLEILIVLKVIFTFVCLININADSVNAQIFGETGRITEQKRIKSNSGRKNQSSPRQATKVVVQFKTIQVPKKITGLTITTLPGATISLESIDLKKKVVKNGKAQSDKTYTFEDLRDGTFKLTVSLDGFEPQETEVIIKPQQITTVPINLKPVTHDFSIKTNVTDGEVRYAPVTVLEPESANGTLKVKYKGGFCMVPIINGKATISEMNEGDYVIDVRAKDAEFQPETSVINIPEDIPEVEDKESKDNASFELNLENTLSKTTFILSSVQENWTLPENWKIDSTGLKANGIGVALPNAKSYRYYKDFEMQSNVRMSDNIAVGFVVRAVDKNNYYLIKLTGDASKNQYLVSGVIYKDGKLKEEVLSLNIDHAIKKAVVEKKDFEVIIKAKGDTFKIFATDVESGKPVPLGDAIFKDNNYPIGAVGVGVDEKANFEVIRFMVCNQICKE
jgi:hypothetical protein